MKAADPASAGGQNPPGAITFPSLAAGGVVSMLATIFLEPDGTCEGITYKSGDSAEAVESASRAARMQMGLYEQWERDGFLTLARPGGTRAGNASKPLTRILVEGADGIRSPGELAEWKSRGVAAVSLAWAKQTRYAGGNMCDTGLTPLGREMVKELDRLGIVHDASHLSDVSLRELFELTDRPVIASHSNCRAILDDGSLAMGPRQRHLTDESIREIGRRGGMVGSVLYSPFIIRGGKRDRRATLAEWADHADRLADLLGSRSRVGLGSDADGGFSAATLPEGVDTPRGYERLAETLRSRGWSDAEVEGFAHGNWDRFWASRPT